MEQVIVYQTDSEYRDDFRIRGYVFGEGERALCVVGSMRGNEVQQMYTCSQLVKRLKDLEAQGMLLPGKKTLVMPCCNPYSMNIRKKFWTIDNTDINRMFPGYSEGEATQRIAAGIFDEAKEYPYGVQFTSFYIRGQFAPHIRMMHTGLEDIELAKEFGLPYVIIRKPRPFDTTTLNYNWQIWETDAFSLYTTNTESVDKDGARQAVNAILRFMARRGILKPEAMPRDEWNIPRVVSDDHLVNVRNEAAGIFDGHVLPGYPVSRGEEMARILDPYDGSILCRVTAPCKGRVLFMHSGDLAYENEAVYKLIRDE